MARRLRQIVIAAAVLPLLMLVGFRTASTAYACRMDGEVRATCCCPPKPDTEHPDGPRLDAANCCDVLFGKTIAAPDAREANRPTTNDLSPFIVGAAYQVVRVAQPTFQLTPVTVARPPPPRLPTYLTNRSILR